MTHIKFDSSALKQFVHENELGEMQAMVNAANDELRNGTGAGADFRDWLHLPTEYDKEEFARIKKAADKIQRDSDVLVVIGIGGSYLGAQWQSTSYIIPSTKLKRQKTGKLHWWSLLVTP